MTSKIEVIVKPNGNKSFSIDTGDMPADEVGRYLEDFIRAYKKNEQAQDIDLTQFGIDTRAGEDE